MPIKFMGVDPSLTSTGIVVLTEGKIEFKTIIKSGVRGVSRLSDLESQFSGILDQYKVDLIAIEGYAYGIGESSMLASLGELGGLFRVCMHRKNLNYINVSPGALKKFVTGKGNSKKEQMLMYTLAKWKEMFEDNNLCDAYGLARVAEAVVKGEQTKSTKVARKLAAEIRKYDLAVNPR